MAQRYRLKLSSLKFISPVDAPAQETALAVLTKRKAGAIKDTAPQITANARVVKTSESLGLVFCWAFTTKSAGADYFDLHGDNVVEDDLIKVAAEFMENGGLTDEMHDRDPDGKVVFCMPLTAEVAKAFGVKTETEGLMIALRPSPEVFAKYVSGEYVGVSIDGTGIRETVKSARVQKHSLYTTEVDGHAHTISVYDDGTLYTSYANAASAANGHSHAVTHDATGALVILADSGHTHQLAAGQPSVIVVSPDAVVVVQASAPNAHTAKSTPSIGVATISSQPENMMTTEAQQIADLTAKLTKAERLATLTDAQRAHYGTLGNDGEAYLAKSFADREAVITAIAKADEVVYTSKSTGETFRKSDDPRLVKMAERQDAQAVELAKRDEEIEKAEVRSFAKAHLGALAGEDKIHDYIVKSIRKGGGDAAIIDAAIATLKGANDAMATKGKAPGAGGVGTPTNDDPAQALDALVEKHAADNKVSFVKARAAVMETAEGLRLYAACK